MMFGKNRGVCSVIPHLPDDSVGIEIGVWRGDSSEQFLAKTKFLYLVDPWSVQAYEDSDEFGDFDAYLRRYEKLVGSTNPATFQLYYDGVYGDVLRRFEGRPVQVLRQTSDEFFATFSGSADWAYIDGSHAFDQCLRDLHNAAHVVQSVFGDDYGVKSGVTLAVNKFSADTGRKVSLLGNNQYWIA